MIGCFPPPYPDELFYSICARYAERVHYPVPLSVLTDLFGSPKAVGIDLPSRLDFLIAALPEGHFYKVDQFIDNHSLLPFYGPFLPVERLRTIREEMHSNGESLYARLGVLPSLVSPPKYLRLCSRCVVDDRTSVGKAYWHRIHQIPGVFVCPIHELALADTPILRQTRLVTGHECFSTAKI